MKIATRTRPSTRCWTSPLSTLAVVTLAMNSGSRKKMPIPATQRERRASARRSPCRARRRPPRPGRSRCGPASACRRRASRTGRRGRGRTAIFDQRGAVEAGIEALGREDDPAVRVAQGDRDRVATAHQDALDERLTAVGVAWASGEVYRLAAGWQSQQASRVVGVHLAEHVVRQARGRGSASDPVPAGPRRRTGTTRRGSPGTGSRCGSSPGRPGRPCRTRSGPPSA